MAELAYRKHKGRPEMARELKRLMWEEGLPVKEAAERLHITRTQAWILCDYYGIRTRHGFDFMQERRVYSPGLIRKVLGLIDDGVMNRTIARDLGIPRNQVTTIRWLFRVNAQKFRSNLLKANGSTHGREIGTPQQWISGCKDSAQYWKDRNPLYYAYWRTLADEMEGREEPLSLTTQDEIWEATRRTMQNMTKT